MVIKLLIFLTALLGGYSEFAVAGLLKDQIFDSNVGQRTYDLYLPKEFSSNLSPLVLLLHGHGGDADVMTGENNKKAPYKVWLTIADREGWVLLIPDGAIGSDDHRGWNDCRENASTNPQTDDVMFLNSLIDAVSDEYPIDKERIYAHGTSNGGNMVFRLALESGDKYRAIAAVVASMPDESKCEESKALLSVLVMNGTDDPILPYHGGVVGKRKSRQLERGTATSTSNTIKYWLNNNDIISKPKVKILPDRNRRDRSIVKVEQYLHENNDTEVILYEIDGAGHTEPSLSEHYRRLYKIVVGNQNKDIEMAEEVWEFFERNR